MDEKLVKEVVGAYGPSGREKKASEVIKSYIDRYSDEIFSDVLGNLIAIKHGSSGKKIMLSVHMDQIGLMVSDIDENGFLYVSRVGGVSALFSVAREVLFENGVHGVTHYGSKVKKIHEITIQDIYIDIGASTKEEAEGMVSIGDIAIFESNFFRMNNRISCRTLDDRMACAAVIETFKTMKNKHDICGVFTVQEEVGCRGGKTAAYQIMPDLNISIDVTDIGDTPECERMSVRLGSGPAVKSMDGNLITPVRVREFIKNVAKSKTIPVQDEVLRFGGTDAGAVQLAGGGILSGCISIPCRYIHTPVELIDIDDYNKTVELLRACCEEPELPFENN